jgi:hypothetical protein
MARTKESKNKNPPTLVKTLNLSVEDRIQCLAILIADAINSQQQTNNLVAEEFKD